ncbi:MAG TPA: hypothetical protein VN641_08490 [Urbifossiella sp.]|nr:hypothetical protein [Urbifossiella sp.]
MSHWLCKREEPQTLRFTALASSEDDGTRTRNHRIDSPELSERKSRNDKRVTPTNAAGCSAGCSDLQSKGGISGPDADPELAAIVVAWPALPEPIRRAMLALIASTNCQNFGS